MIAGGRAATGAAGRLMRTEERRRAPSTARPATGSPRAEEARGSRRGRRGRRSRSGRFQALLQDRRKIVSAASCSCVLLVGRRSTCCSRRSSALDEAVSNLDDADVVLGRHRDRVQRARVRAPTWRCSAACSAARATTTVHRRLDCAPRTRSRWPAWPPRASSRPPARAGSCSPTGRCARRACRAGAPPAGWSPSSCSRTASTWRRWSSSAILLRTGVLPGDAPLGGTVVPAGDRRPASSSCSC